MRSPALRILNKFYLTLKLRPGINKGILVHFNMSCFQLANHISAIAFYFTIFMDCFVVRDASKVAFQNPSGSDLHVFEELTFALGTFYG